MATTGTASVTPPPQDIAGEEEDELPAFFKIGTLVNVESRTWAGINKPGGVGRVTGFDLEDRTIDVRYVLGGVEKAVDVEYVEEHKFEGDDSDNGGDGRNVRTSARTRRRPSSNDDIVKEKEQKNKRTKRAFKDVSSQANKMKKVKLHESTTKYKTKAGTKRKAGDDVKAEKSTKKKKSSKTKKPVKKPLMIRSRAKVMPTLSETLTDKAKTNTKDKKSNKSNVITEQKETRNNLNDAKIILIKEETKFGEKLNAQEAPKVDNKFSIINPIKKTSARRPIVKIVPVVGKILTSKDRVKLKKSNKLNIADRMKKKTKEKTNNVKENEIKNMDKISGASSSSSDTKSLPSTDSTAAQRQNIIPTCVLQSVYKDIKTQATTFVKEMVGRKDTSSAPSSPESTVSLEIQMERGREKEFDVLFSAIIRQKMLDAIELKDLLVEIEVRAKDKPFTKLEVNQHLDRLDKNNKVMVSSGSIYVL